MPTERTPEAGVPLMEQLKRMLPAFLTGQQGDQRLPMPADGYRDSRLPPPTTSDMILEGLDRVRSLAAPKGDPATAAMEALRRSK